MLAVLSATAPGMVPPAVDVVAALPGVEVWAAPSSLETVITNLRNWLVGLLAALATIFLTMAGFIYLFAGGDPHNVERAKIAVKSAAIGYLLAAVSPLLIDALSRAVGAS